PQLRVAGNDAIHTALTADAGLWECREREEVQTFSAAMCRVAQHRLGMIAGRAGVDAESREWLMPCREAEESGKPDAFQLCTFSYFDALASVGRRNSVGPLSEVIDPQKSELWGNFPRTDSQVWPIPSAVRPSRNWEEGLWHAS